jgi:NAD(P)-dependent dehydrogenase (short-subunit alcohol dehydrogenase family)
VATFELTGKTVLLTSATDGLGRALAPTSANQASTAREATEVADLHGYGRTPGSAEPGA